MSVLVTGGSGSLGRYLPYLHKPASSNLNLLVYEELSNYIKKHKISKIIHCAAVTGPKQVHAEKPCDILLQNSIINANVIRACAEYSLHNSIFISSVCIFPYCGSVVDETSVFEGQPSKFHREYAMTKRLMMLGLQALKSQYGIESRCLIPCNFTSSAWIHSIANVLKKPNPMFDFSSSDSKYLMDVTDFVRIILEAESRKEFPSLLTVVPPKPIIMGELVSNIADFIGVSNKNILYSNFNQQYRSSISSDLFQKTFLKFEWKNIKNIINNILINYD